MEDLRVWMGLTKEEREQRRQQIDELKRATYLSKEQQKAWVDLTGQLRIAGATIWTTFVRQLTPLAKPIAELSKAFTGAVVAFLKMPIISKAIDWASEKLNEFAKWLGSDASQKQIQNFFKWVSDFGAMIARHIPSVKDIENTFENIRSFFSKLNNAVDEVLKFFGVGLEKDKEGRSKLPDPDMDGWKRRWLPKWLQDFVGVKPAEQNQQQQQEQSKQTDATKDLTKSMDDLNSLLKMFGMGGGAGMGGNQGWAGARRGTGSPFGRNTVGGTSVGGLSLTASKDMSPEDRALLDVLALHELGKASYLSNDPDCGAAFQGNRYQFLGSTWASNAREIGARAFLDPIESL